MTTPTVFSDVAGTAETPAFAKREPQDVTPQRGSVTVAASTASGTNIGLIRIQKGWSLTGLAIDTADLDTGTDVTLDVGYLYDDTTGEDDDFFFSASTIAQGGGKVVWPADSTALNIGTSVVATGDGYLSITTGGGATTTEGDISFIAQFTYDL